VPLRETLSQIQTAWEELARSDSGGGFCVRGSRAGPASPRSSGFSPSASGCDCARKSGGRGGCGGRERGSPAIAGAGKIRRPAGSRRSPERSRRLADQLAQGTATEAFGPAGQDRARPAEAGRGAGFPRPRSRARLPRPRPTRRRRAKHLNDRDPRAATEPATRAAQTLQAALAALETAGRARGAEVLATTQRS